VYAPSQETLARHRAGASGEHRPHLPDWRRQLQRTRCGSRRVLRPRRLTCCSSAIHGSKLWTGLRIDAAASYDSTAAAKGALNVTLVCNSPLCAASANGFLLVPSGETAAPAGTLLPASPGWSQSLGACGGLTHTQPENVTSWEFLWLPSAGQRGTVTFSAAVAASYDTSFLAVACLLDSASSASEDTSMAGMVMRRSRALQGAARSCPSSSSSGSGGMNAAHSMGMMQSAFFTQPTGWGSLLFRGAVISSPSKLAAAVTLSALFSAFTVVITSLTAPLERRAVMQGVTPLQALAGAAAMVMRTSSHYLCMLLVMSFQVYIFLAVVGGHAMGVLVLAVLRRAALLPNPGEKAASSTTTGHEEAGRL